MQEFAQQQLKADNSHSIISARPPKMPGPAHDAHPLAGQQAMGNQAVQRMLRIGAIQAKLTVNEPGDKYEQEADRIAEQVMSMPEPTEMGQEGRMQPKCQEDLKNQPNKEDKEGQVQAKPIAEQITPLVQRRTESEEDENEEKVQAKSITGQIKPLLQRQAETNEEGEESVQAKARNGAISIVDPTVHAQIHGLHGGGRPLANDVRTFFEERFSYDFGRVRIHTDERAMKMAETLNAQAFTFGRNIVFGSRQAGERLLAHELVHVIQQRNVSPIQVQRQLRMGAKKSVERHFAKKEKKSNPQDTLDALRALINKITRKIFRRKAAWDIAYRNLGSAYSLAYDRHEKAVIEANTEEAITFAVAFGVLTMVTAGALGSIGVALSTGKIGRYFFETHAKIFEPMIHAAFSELIDVAQLILAPKAIYIGQIPLNFQNDLLNANDMQLEQMLDYLDKIEELLEKNFRERPKIFEHPDLKSVEWMEWSILDQWFGKNKLMAKPRTPKVKDLAEELERMFWAKWAPELAYYVFAKEPPISTHYKMPGTAVEKRLDYLGITKAAGIGEKFGWITTQADVEKFVNWSYSYKPKSFSKQFEI